jgi:C-terminal processing protease CtpA/Prc
LVFRFLLCLLLTALAQAQSVPSESDRLLSTAKLWITVKYFHPSLAYRDINWDQALIDTLPKIRSAQTPSEYKSAIESLVQPLATSTPNSGTGQRLRFYHGLPPEIGDPVSAFYAAFLYKPTNVNEEIIIPMSGFSVKVPLSEPATAGPPIPLPTSAKIYADPFPSTELRILAAFKIWGILHYFFAYRDLIDEDWDGLLAQFLPRMIAAKDALEYNLTVAEWLTHAADTFTAAHSETLTRYFGEAPVGLRTRIVEKHVVVTEILDPAASKAGIKIGDIIKQVDGETLVNRYQRFERYVPASTPQRLGLDVTNRILNGPTDSNALLTIEDHAGSRKEVKLKRGLQFADLLSKPEESGEPMKLLHGSIGYADLRRIKRQEVDSLFEKFRNTAAIIFDMRGIPADDSISTIAAHLTSEPDVAGAIVTGPLVATPDLQRDSTASASSSYFFLQTLPHSQFVYHGKTALLVDERTIGKGEEAGLFFEAANKTEIIGAPTAGALSVLSNFTIPGAITISFSGQDIRHANGGKLQRLGLQPNVNATPSLLGIRNSKDEVLDKALDEFSPNIPRLKGLPARAVQTR